MAFRIVWAISARKELTTALAWYREQRPGLDHDLIKILDTALADLTRNPHLSSKVGSRSRRVRLHRFPYAIYFTVDEEIVSVIGFRHSRRKPME